MVHFQLISFKAQSFLHSVFNALGRGNLFRIGLIRIIQTCVITWKFSWKFSSFFGPIQLLLFPLGWVVVLLGLFFVLDAGNAVQKPLTKRSFHRDGLNCGTCACETHVITTTPCWVCGNLDVLVQYVDFATCFWLMSSAFKRFARNKAGPYSLH